MTLITTRPWLSWLGSSTVVCLAAGLPARVEPSGAPSPREVHRNQERELRLPEGLTYGDWASICSAYESGRLAVYADEDGCHARNPGQEWLTRFDGRGFTITSEAEVWTWGLELRSYGFAGEERAVEGTALMCADGTRVTYTWDNALEEWYENQSRGLKHGYTLIERPRRNSEVNGEAPLSVTLAMRGGLRAEMMDDGRGVAFVNESGARVLTYSDLVVFDAQQRTLPARLALARDGLQLLVDERDAHYPLTIDPIAMQVKAYLKASNTGGGDVFGFSVSISGDTAVVGAYQERSNATGVNGNQADDSLLGAGAAYVFVRSGLSWTQQAYLKASNTDQFDSFGYSVSISGDTVVVGAFGEDSNATGVDGDDSNNSASDSGAAYVFVRSGTTWTQQAYLKASNTDAFDQFGRSVSVSGDTLVVGALEERSNATGVNGNQSDNSALSSGAAYVFVRSGTTWSQQAYLKASNTEAGDVFGFVSVSGDTVVVGARFEDSNATGVNGSQNNNSASGSGAAYVFVRSGTAWSQQAYLKASNTGAGDGFGISTSISGDTVLVGADGEDSNSIVVNGNQSDNSATSAGAVYVFVRSGTTWTQQAYLKPFNTNAHDIFGWSVSVSDNWAVVGALFEDSNATGTEGDESDNSATDAGAAYLFVRSGTTWTQEAYFNALQDFVWVAAAA